MSAKKRILVIGAGTSGLTAIKACKEESLDVVCYEKSGDFGGLWRYRENNEDGAACVMKFTVSNSSKEMSCFSDFPPAEYFPMYMPHVSVLKYLEQYGQHFDLFSCIHYYEEVIEVTPAEDYPTSGKWQVKVRKVNSEEIREEVFDGVMVCSGHHGFPLTPEYPGLDLFMGTKMHSHDYKSFEGFEDKTVLVVGAGNSGGDVAVDLTNVAKQVYLSTRRGAWIFPRTLAKGKPIDVTLTRRYFGLQPASMANNKVENMINAVMNHEKYGLRPYHKILSQHPTINDELRVRLASGAVIVKKNVVEFTENGAKFENADEVINLDAVIFATGYHIKFPFLGEDIFNVGKNNQVFLYKTVFPPHLLHPTLALIGLIQPHSSLFPVFEMQSRWFVSIMVGNTQLPSTDAMMAHARRREDFRTKNFVQSARHSIEYDWIDYMDDIADEIGVKPKLPSMFFQDPKLYWACLMGPLLPYQFRLNGPHKWRGAREAILNYKERMYGFMRSQNKATIPS